MIYLAIDPGSVSGAYAAIDHNNTFIGCGDIPNKGGCVLPKLLSIKLQELIPKHDSCEIIIENVHAMPKQGVSSTFNFGRAYGVIEAVANMTAYPVHFVSAQCWKKHHGLIGKPKTASVDLARSIWPSAPLNLKRHHGRADALLMALYGLRTLA